MRGSTVTKQRNSSIRSNAAGQPGVVYRVLSCEITTFRRTYSRYFLGTDGVFVSISESAKLTDPDKVISALVSFLLRIPD